MTVRSTLLLATSVAAVLVVAVVGADPRPSPGTRTTTEVVVTLASKPLAYAGRDNTAAARRIAAEQRRFTSALGRLLPEARIRWRYRLVANGFAVVVPERSIALLHRLPGVRYVNRGTVYAAALDDSPGQIGATTTWGPDLATAGQGMKIGIIDDGVDHTHPFLDPTGYAMPAGFPKGQQALTTAKVIVARAFAPPEVTWRHATKAFDPELSSHGTHVAGIAAGNYRTPAAGGARVSGVAPRAYIGSYKALSVPMDAVGGLNGNAPELVAAIEAAVADGMDVINMSIGEAEIEPSRDVVALALDAAAAAGVVPVVAAGNGYEDYGRGSISSPGNSAAAITVAAASIDADEADVASFSSAGPTPISLRLKPDLAAPGVAILSSVPGGWAQTSGTSMAAPHVAGGAALLLQRHPDWTPAQVKSALVASARPFGGGAAASPTRVGTGLVDLLAADDPLVLASPTGASFGFLTRGQLSTASVALTADGAGAGNWSATVEMAGAPEGTAISSPSTVTVPGSLDVTVLAGAVDGEASGVVRLSRAGVTRRIPFWLRVSTPALAGAASTNLSRPGAYRGNTRGRPALVSTYRYPEVRPGATVTDLLAGPEQVFRVRLRRPVANFGVVVTSRAPGVRVEPRVIVAGDENRLTGLPGLPEVLNPYLVTYGDAVLAAGAVRPAVGTYDVVFDSATADGAGPFTFRYWLDDVAPPAARLLTTAVRRGAAVGVRVSDTGSGIDRTSLRASVDGRPRSASISAGIVRIPTAGLARGRHKLRLQVSDLQETRNMENVAGILPNTRVLRTSFVVR